MVTAPARVGRRYPIFDPEADSLDAGGEERNQGIAQVLGRESVDWKTRARAALCELASQGERFNADDVSRLVGRPPRHPNSMGGVFNWAIRKGIIVRFGERSAKRRPAHARRVAVYVGASAAQSTFIDVVDP
jgi:hypothetical protein